ncbi:MAG: hypothetical protein BWY78_00839 [Alphaproteobacteria bacterium ADurb.Bin438]|nr:MAG: hypothetical protein BWY78_00839 [Alphaproteobacteria bacterium ADurb.Bin438]
MIRKALYAGSFYPENKETLIGELDSYLKKPLNADFLTKPNVIICPHAGYVFSGEVAGNAYALIRNENYKKVVVFSPSHQVSLTKIAFCSKDYYETPFNRLKVDKNDYELCKDIENVIIFDKPHILDHGIEVQLPFLSHVLKKDFLFTPIIVGAVDFLSVVKVMEKLFDKDTLFVISCDLSHYLGKKEACEKDKETVKNIENYDYFSLKEDDSCGFFILKPLLYFAKQEKMKIRLLNFKNSGDISSDYKKVVGYASFALWKE